MVVKKQNLKWVGGVVVVALIVALGLTIFWRGNKERILAEALAHSLEVNTVATTAELELRLPVRQAQRDRPFTTIKARVEGQVTPGEEGAPEMTGRLLLEGRGRGNIFFADGDLRILKDAVLFKLDNLPVLLDPMGKLVNTWTRVETSLLATRNGAAVKEALREAVHGVSYVGGDTVANTRLLHFHGALTGDQEQALLDVIRPSVSGNRALGVLARLLQANNVEALDIWVDPSTREIRRLSMHFVRPLSEGRTYDFATLTMDFSDYGKTVVIDRPETVSRVKPEVFGRVFGSGEIGVLPVE